MMNSEYIVEPIEFLFTKDFLKGMCGINDRNYIINNVTDAYRFAFEQDLPREYKIWQDVIENLRGFLRKHDDFHEAYDFVNNHLEGLQNKNSSLLLEYRKKKIKKTNEKYDDFLFSEVREDAFFVLCTVAINRFLNNYISDPFLENVFSAYKNGGWPCGIKEGNILIFDPSLIS